LVLSYLVPPGMRMRPRGSPRKLAKAREMRKKPTEAERRVWQLVRGRRVQGLKFRRQAVIAGFIADFYCAEQRLILELDGSFHEDQEVRDYDLCRDEVLRKPGYKVIRIANDMATPATLERIVRARLGV